MRATATTWASIVVDRLAADVGGRFSSHRSRSDVLTGRLGWPAGRPGPRVVLAKPQTYMNESGGPVSGLVRFFRVPLDRLLVVHDELDLPISGASGSSAAVARAVTTGCSPYQQSLGHVTTAGCGWGSAGRRAAWILRTIVLRDVSAGDRAEQALMVEDGADAAKAVVRIGLERAADTVNRR